MVLMNYAPGYGRRVGRVYPAWSRSNTEVPDLSADITGDQYHVVTIPNIKVKGGKCEIGFSSNGDAKAFTMIDDVAFYESTGYGAKVAEVLKSAGGFRRQLCPHGEAL